MGSLLTLRGIAWRS